MTLQILTNQLSIIDNEISAINKQLESLPKGKLSLYQSGKYIRWVRIFNNKKIAISKKQKDFAHQLLLYELLSDRLTDLFFERKQIQSCIKQFESYSPAENTFWRKKHLKSFLNTNSPIISISSASSPPTDILGPSQTTSSSWNNLPYIKNNHFQEQLIYPSISGNHLRSKSEVIIDQSMYFNKIDYRYECQLYLDGIELYPDFLAISNSTKKLIVWEHLGMMDDPTYVNSALSKIKLYIKNGFIPGINLILTSETTQNPLNPLLVNDLIQRFLL